MGTLHVTVDGGEWLTGIVLEADGGRVLRYAIDTDGLTPGADTATLTVSSSNASVRSTAVEFALQIDPPPTATRIWDLCVGAGAMMPDLPTDFRSCFRLDAKLWETPTGRRFAIDVQNLQGSTSDQSDTPHHVDIRSVSFSLHGARRPLGVTLLSVAPNGKVRDLGGGPWELGVADDADDDAAFGYVILSNTRYIGAGGVAGCAPRPSSLLQALETCAPKGLTGSVLIDLIMDADTWELSQVEAGVGGWYYSHGTSTAPVHFWCNESFLHTQEGSLCRAG